MADGSVVFSISADDAEAQKKLDALRKDIERTQKQLNQKTEKRDGISAQLTEAREEARKLQEELAEIQRQRAEAEKVYSGNAPGRAVNGATVDPAAFFAAREQLVELGKAQDEVNAKLGVAEKNVQKLEVAEQRATAEVDKQTQLLATQQSEAGELEQRFASSAQNILPQLSGQLAQVNANIRKGVKNILKWGFGIRSAFILVRKLRSALKEGLKAFAEQDAQTKENLDNLKSGLSTLKVAWGAAFAPILNAVAPILDSLIDNLIDAANAMQMFFAVMTGSTTYQRIVRKNEAMANSYTAVGNAAGDAKKQLMGFDEINRLDGQDGGGGGGGAAKTWETIEETIEGFQDGFLGQLALGFKDLIIDWGDLNPEQIAKKIIGGLSGLLGAFLAASLELGAGGAILLTIGGIVLGVLINGLIFNGDGKISKKELLKMISLAITAIVGGIIGFHVGGFKGAMIGATIGVGIWLAIQSVLVKEDTKGLNADSLMLDIMNVLIGGLAGFMLAPPGAGLAGAAIGATIALGITLLVASARLDEQSLERFKQTALGEEIERLKSDIEDGLTVTSDLRIKISSITGELDDNTIADFTMAKQLIDSIFTLDDTENLTAEQATLLREQVELLNSIGLDGLQLTFDEATGHIQQTREEVSQLYDQILKQYQLQAVSDAYMESYRAEYEAAREVEKATADVTNAKDRLWDAQRRQTLAYEEYAQLRDEYEGHTVDLTITLEAYEQLAQKVRDAKTAYEDAGQGVGEAKTVLQEATQYLEESLGAYDEAYSAMDDIVERWAEIAVDADKAGKNAQEGFKNGLSENAHIPVDEVIKTGREMKEAIDNELDMGSPSREMEQRGEWMMDGLKNGIVNKAQEVVSTLRLTMQEVLAAVQESVDEISQVWQSDWGRPHIQIPVFALNGNVNFRTGEVPQLRVAEWRWLAKGGILDRATLIGAGEAGKEAIVPLERNTEWINLVADGLLDRLARSPVLNGSIVPPRAVSNGGSMFTDGDIQKLVNGIVEAFGGDSSSSSPVYIDGEKVAEIVTRHQRRAERSFA